MKTEENNIEDLIGKVLAAEATREEVDVVNVWRSAHEGNEKEFQQLTLIFEKAGAVTTSPDFDPEAAWKKIQPNLLASATSGRSVQLNLLIRIAAAIALILMVTVLLRPYLQKPEPAYSVSTEKGTRMDTLPDGSTAYLNKQSTLSYEYNASQKQRTVKLNGEAFLEIQHVEEKPFLLEAQGVFIKDIGTSFNVKAYPGQDTVNITVTNGEVKAFTASNPGLFLKAGESAVYSRKLNAFYRLEKTDTNVLAYQSKVFTFHNSDLKTVVDKINEVYDTQLVIQDPAVNNCRITVNFNGESPEVMAEILAETLKLTVIHEGEKIILAGQGCQ